MKINTFEKCVKTYNENLKDQGGWDKDDSKKRAIILATLPFSVVVEGDYIEHDKVIEWLNENLGAKEREWDELWYGKIDYDYGFWEFFFEKEEDKVRFQSVTESLIVTYLSGIQGRTMGSADIVE